MPVKGLVLVKTDPKKTHQCIKSLPGNVLSVSGRFDAVITVEVKTPKEIAEFVLGKVRRHDGVTNTETFVVVREKISKKTGAVNALVLINASPTKTDNAYEILSKLKETTVCCAVTGSCDIICIVATSSMDKLSEFLLKKLRRIPGITNTETLLVT